MSEPGLVFVMFGATGDLARRELLPNIVDIGRKQALGRPFELLGVALEPGLDDDGFRKLVVEAVAADGGSTEGLAAWCSEHVQFHPASPDGACEPLAARLSALDGEAGKDADRIFYLALPPAAFGSVIAALGRAGLARGAGWTRLVIEKPFGQDLSSAQQLNEIVHRHFDESQIYRIDHFIGKETVQNLLVFRFANTVFESLWNRDRIKHVQITVAEEFGIRQRGKFFEATGCMRDMVQNHLTQILTHLAMEVPVAYDADSVRFEKIKTLRSIAPIHAEDVVYGQYGPGTLNREALAGYRQEPDVAPDSRVETYVALRLSIESWRWRGVPFYLRTGKRLPRRVTQIVVTFRDPPVRLFESLSCAVVPSNRLVITLQPNEGFALHFAVKRPGDPMQLESMPLHFRYAEAFGPLPEAYATLLSDVVQGDQTLFVHAAEVEAAWKLYTPLLTADIPTRIYPAGSWGPPEADALLARAGHRWLSTP